MHLFKMYVVCRTLKSLVLINKVGMHLANKNMRTRPPGLDETYDALIEKVYWYCMSIEVNPYCEISLNSLL